LRAMGLLLVGYVFVAIALQLPRHAANGLAGAARFATRSALWFVPAFALGYVIMIAAWPWAALDLFNPVRAIFSFPHFQYPVRTIVMDQVYQMADAPRWYVPMYFLIKLPLVTFLGVLAAIWFAARGLRNGGAQSMRYRETAFILFVALFPLACQVIPHRP